MKPVVLAVIGARPQFVKAAALERAYRSMGARAGVKLEWLDTGQHYDRSLSGVFFEELGLPKPRFSLRAGSGTHAEQTARILAGAERAFVEGRPDAVLVFGDTNSTLAAALAAAKLGIRLVHVEAGLRSYNRAMPEEANRVVTDHLSDILFCPTATAVRQLAREGVKRGVHLVGDVMADLLLSRGPRRGDVTGDYYLATIHRNFNTDDPKRLEAVLRTLSGLGRRIIFPVHPRTRKTIAAHARLASVASSAGLEFVPPASYDEMLELERRALGIVTDSGGVQKEAYLLGVPCVTLRTETEWPETVRDGMNVLCEPEARSVLRAFRRMKPKPRREAFGKGDASERILRILARELKKERT